MAAPRLRLAVTPLRRQKPLPQQAEPLTTAALVARLRPEEPLHCLRRHAVTAAARSFLAAFPGEVLYAVKCNPDPRVLSALWQGGLRHFDCASPAEVDLVRQLLPEAAIHYMHPVKARSAIREAYNERRVRDFALDSMAELEKIREETAAEDIGLIVRLALPRGPAGHEARLDLSGKFGAGFDEAVMLLQQARSRAWRVGLAFHVGSQCAEPEAWARAIRYAGDVAAAARVKIDILDIGGGFPVAYPGEDLPMLGRFMAAIEKGWDHFRARLGENAPSQLWAEPGRALVAQGGSIVVQVQGRRGDALYINDGVYGGLADAGSLRWRFPLRLLRKSEVPARDFVLYGPTCDSLDKMDGGFSLPGDVGEGDWIEIGQTGAYSGSLRTAFNGFDRAHLVEVEDPPLQLTPGYDWR